MIKYADRLNSLPPYAFAEVDKAKHQKIKEGVDVIDLGVGDPDTPTPDYVIDSLCKAVHNPETHQYPSYSGSTEFRDAAAGWFAGRFGVKLNMEKEIITLIGSKEGIAHIPEAFVNPGDYTLCPNPGYPVYGTATTFAEGIPYAMPLLAENGFKPDLAKIPKDIVKKSKMLFINYPNNPTAAIADKKFFREAVDFGKDNGLVVVHDNAYSEVTYDGYKAPSILEVPGAMDCCIEIHSLSKTSNMTGWRIGFAVGNADIVAGLGKVKMNVDSGAFLAVQLAAIDALKGAETFKQKMSKVYQARRDALLVGLKTLGIKMEAPKATFYVWAPVPGGNSTEYAKFLIDKAGVVCTPGVSLGKYGEGYVRFSLTRPIERINEAVERMKKI
ncbi:putative aminotransferase [Methanocella paludicola SANAE]|uniref:Aminotransferase n=1 Tax=Methanocella paludicola (strain DSM 17711 / JCM 13418 / NBRC 101707 / SANAE) TaxID=304371 RepID=D1YWW0_METPS|nr:LL-diaminopimelate aminotransferase [Methanocella paludicola]BAI60932.1 putative aminotransferase [Methanocella paludicola SANAE]